MSTKTGFWWLWGAMSLAVGGYLVYLLFATQLEASPGARLLSAGPMTHGHHQIELACTACHAEPFGGDSVLQQACVDCHGAELKAANDSHPTSKFTDPRNADRLQKVDARLCIACHTEHRPEITGAMGLTLPEDVCFHCHKDIAEERPTHTGMGFETCASAGCHNFHDNRALYEDFLVKHAGQPEQLEPARVRLRDPLQIAALSVDYPRDRYPLHALDRETIDAPPAAGVDSAAVDDWLASSHARAGVNCSACHGGEQASATPWVERPDHTVCLDCHGPEGEGFMVGRHGMRLAQGLEAMSPAEARIPMHAEAAGRSLGCTSCHTAHRFDTAKAAASACLGCHDDQHSRAYEDSPHHELWRRERAGELPPGSGVSCATCHLPRFEQDLNDAVVTRVQHNQNDNLRPNEKMIRSVCQDCHGLAFAIDALADPALVQDNFHGRPARRIESIEMALGRVKD